MYKIIPSDLNNQQIVLVEDVVRISDYRIIVVWSTNNGSNNYWAGNNDWFKEFGNPYEMENPHSYCKYKAAERMMLRLKMDEEIEDSKIHLALWIHPDSDFVPLEKYLNMDGIQFPTCPTQ